MERAKFGCTEIEAWEHNHNVWLTRLIDDTHDKSTVERHSRIFTGHELVYHFVLKLGIWRHSPNLRAGERCRLAILCLCFRFKPAWAYADLDTGRRYKSSLSPAIRSSQSRSRPVLLHLAQVASIRSLWSRYESEYVDIIAILAPASSIHTFGPAVDLKTFLGQDRVL